MKSCLSISILFFLILLSCQICSAQIPDYVPMPKDTAIWGHVKDHPQPSPTIKHHLLTIQMGDTMFNGKKYKKLYYKENTIDWGTDTSWASSLDIIFNWSSYLSKKLGILVLIGKI